MVLSWDNTWNLIIVWNMITHKKVSHVWNFIVRGIRKDTLISGKVILLLGSLTSMSEMRSFNSGEMSRFSGKVKGWTLWEQKKEICNETDTVKLRFLFFGWRSSINDVTHCLRIYAPLPLPYYFTLLYDLLSLI